tara:strand:+ start:670 stop:1356 length:687 start_codon:yes stop_codon:yes gene_type:complete
MEDFVFYGGVVPFQLYSMVGYFISISQFLLSRSDTSLRFFLLPHLFSYSFVSLLKTFFEKYELPLIPSGQSSLCFCLTTVILCELNYSKNTKIFDFTVSNYYVQLIISILAVLVSLLSSYDTIINREENESIGGSIIGAILGIIIGLTVWKNYASSNDKVKEKFILSETNMDILRIILTVITFILLLEFIYSTYKDIDTLSDAGYITEKAGLRMPSHKPSVHELVTRR